MRRGIAGLLVWAVAVGALGGSARATSASNPAVAAPASPKGGVARISVIEHGSVVLAHGDSKQQETGAVNAPVLPGDFLSTAADTRAELQFDGFTTLRLGGGVQLRLVSDDPKARSVQLAEGTVELALLHEEEGAATVDTPSITIRATQPGDVRITVAPDGSTAATARSGSAELITPQKTYGLEPGKTLVARGSAASPDVTAQSEIAYDAFDDFNAIRDKALFGAIDNDANVPQSIAGYDDLSAYGKWVEVEPYGSVWTPSDVPAGWAPYRDGQWTWVAGYGWTWVSNEPWGWVPYHYGRWFYDSTYGWCWYPPAVTFAPTWQPALVNFFGWGQPAGSDSWGNVGWVPVAPFESFYPWSGYGYGYVPPIAQATPPPSNNPRPPMPSKPKPVKKKPPVGLNQFRNAAAGGATFVTARAFGLGDFSHAAPVDASSVRGITLPHGVLPIKPGASNFAFVREPVATPVAIKAVFAQSRFTSEMSAAHAPSSAVTTRATVPVTSVTHESSPTTLQAPSAGAPAASNPAQWSAPVVHAAPAPAPAPVTPPHDPAPHDPPHPQKPPA